LPMEAEKWRRSSGRRGANQDLSRFAPILEAR